MSRCKSCFSWIAAALLLILGIAVYAGIPGFRFSAYMIWGIAALILLYRLLRLLRKHKPKLGKVLHRLLTVCLCLGILAAGITGILIGNAAAGHPETACDYMIVLGAGVNGTVPSYILRQRLNAAYDYLAANPDTICIVSGGQGPGEDISEAQCMYDDLTGRGIAAERIWLEDKSTSTRENLRFSLDLIEEKTGTRPKTAGVLSNEFHLFRAGLVAKELGLDAIGIPADTKWFSLFLNYFLREIPAVWYYVLLGG